MEAKRYQMYIEGKWVDSDTGKCFEVKDPATEEVVGTLPDAGAPETRKAIEAAHKAFPAWAATPAKVRGEYLMKVRDLMLQRAEHLARTITAENGKPVPEAKGEVAFASIFLGWFAEEAKRIYGEVIPAPFAHKRLLVIRQPVGVAGAITPWNFPATMITRKVSPALAAGCTVVLKPAEQTPLTALELARLFEEAQLPPGVLNVVTALDPVPVGKELLTNRLVRKIGFTGSTEVGKLLMQGAAEQLKRVSFELGGHAPYIIFEDADLEKAIDGAIAAKFLRAAGQSCICINRIYVHIQVAEEFTKGFAEKAMKLKVANGFEEGAQVGPLIDRHGFEKVSRHVEDALKKGATLVCGGRRIMERGMDKGYFYEPTVLANVNHTMLITKEETFGPVAPIIPFEKEEEVIAMANDTDYGLAAYLFTKDLGRAFRVAERLEVGMVGVNDAGPQTPEAPFGGVKESGIGREGGRQGIDEYLEDKFISIGI